jgi:hypothetical protein
MDYKTVHMPATLDTMPTKLKPPMLHYGTHTKFPKPIGAGGKYRIKDISELVPKDRVTRIPTIGQFYTTSKNRMMFK